MRNDRSRSLDPVEQPVFSCFFFFAVNGVNDKDREISKARHTILPERDHLILVLRGLDDTGTPLVCLYGKRNGFRRCYWDCVFFLLWMNYRFASYFFRFFVLS